MPIMKSAVAEIAALAAMTLSPTTMAQARPPVDFSLKLSSGVPASAAGAGLRIRYRAAGDPYAKPAALRRVVIALPSGARYDGAAIPTCTAGDAELMVLGAAACPPASVVGDGIVTAVTGAGVPLDPMALDATLVNTGDGVLQILAAHATNLVLLLLHGAFTAPGTLTFDPVPSVPGAPPDFKSSVRAVSIRLHPAGTAARPFITTPPTCPASQRWRSILTYGTTDGHTYTARSSTPCRRPASAPRPSTFTGLCRLSGAVSFSPPLTIGTRLGAVVASATGTCDGDVTDGHGTTRASRAANASLTARSHGSESCAAGTGSGAATLTIAGETISYDYNERRAGPALVLTAAGPGGAAAAEGNVSPTENPLTLLQACGTGGLARAPIDIRLSAH